MLHTIARRHYARRLPPFPGPIPFPLSHTPSPRPQAPGPSRYVDPAVAAAYARKYTRSPARRVSFFFERRLLLWALRQIGPVATLLDAPCGAGRFLPALRRRAERVVGADISHPMLALASATGPGAGGACPGDLVHASTFALPFARASFDAVVCWRLLHHLPDPAVRVRLLAELGRVARRALIVSFADAGAWKARRRDRRAAGGQPRRRVAIPAERFAEEARAAGLALARTRRLSRFFSDVACALLLK
ncbi:MAG: class I SAM-dependent methyltransferase [Planctomycetes bacterium]|nr:class I SAM-dependent methyltransferase [Planctomycetota bacterium]